MLDDLGNPPKVIEIPDETISTITANEFSKNKKDNEMKIDLSKLDPQVKAAYLGM